MKTLIVGAALGYNADKLAPFVISLRRAGYLGDCLLFCDYPAPDARTQKLLETWRIDWEPFQMPEPAPCCPHMARHYKLAAFLDSDRGRSYDYFLHCDTRDVVFQSDPFAVDLSVPLYHFAEEGRRLIGQSESNRDWVRAGFGEAALRRLEAKAIFCGGTILGSALGMRAHVSATLKLAEHLNPDSLFMPGIDQATHLMIVHQGIVPGAVLVPNQKLVNTLGLVPRADLSLRNDGFIVNRDGSISAVIHQYDYPGYEDINQAILARYRADLAFGGATP
ncbi:MAG: hypothetical protein ACPGOV_10340 [Magnetovibrionaceae bacterium]